MPNPPSRTGQGRRGGPAIWHQTAPNSQLPVALSTDTDTPGPMVELSETRFM